MTARRLLTAHTDQLDPARTDELTALCEAAFGRPFASTLEAVGPGLHVMVEVGRRLVSHAMIVDRRIYVGVEPDVALDAGYVEHVATLPELQGAGHGAAAMAEIGRIIAEEYALGALGTRDRGFYARLAWEIWRGPTFVLMPDGERVRSASTDGEVMVLRTPRTPPTLDLNAPIAVEWRPEEPW